MPNLEKEIRAEDFEHVYNTLIAAYRPVLEEFLKPGASPGGTA